jgi:hypothetical protein
MLLLEGAPGNWLRPAAADERRYLPLPDPIAPHLVIDLSHRSAGARAVGVWNPPGTPAASVKHLAGRVLLRGGLLPPLRPQYIVRARPSTVPAIVERAAQTAKLDVGQWFLVAERGPDHKRLAFFLAPTGAARPTAVVKFARLPGDLEKIERGVRGLEVATRAGNTVSDHAPRFLASFAIAGHHAAIESAAYGRTLGRFLASSRTRARKVLQLDALVRWLGAVARTTSSRRNGVGEDLRCAIQRSGLAQAGSEKLLRLAAGTPAVCEHGDLADGNIIVGDGTFTIIDWEHARFDGYPTWDLVYLSLYCLPLLDGARGVDEHVRYLHGLFAGRAPSSRLFFSWLRATAIASGIARTDIPDLVRLGLTWFVDLQERHGAARDTLLRRFASEWLPTSPPGSEWRAWVSHQR